MRRYGRQVVKLVRFYCRCTSPKPIGWVAAPIFVSFVLVATFVILNLFIGVINENMGIAKEQLVEMKKQEVLNKSQANPADDSSTLRRDIILLERQVKRLAKRSARLHQAMGMLGYDLRVLAANLQKRSKGRNKVLALPFFGWVH